MGIKVVINNNKDKVKIFKWIGNRASSLNNLVNSNNSNNLRHYLVSLGDVLVIISHNSSNKVNLLNNKCS